MRGRLTRSVHPLRAMPLVGQNRQLVQILTAGKREAKQQNCDFVLAENSAVWEYGT
jgi:hypothetical protein